MHHLQHRGPDECGVYHSPAIAVGHHRLSIIDLDGGKQPMTNLEGDTLVFNGEIYNFQALAHQAQAEGIHVEQRSDTDVLFQLLCHLPVPDVLERLEGMFAFAFTGLRFT